MLLLLLPVIDSRASEFMQYHILGRAAVLVSGDLDVRRP